MHQSQDIYQSKGNQVRTSGLGYDDLVRLMRVPTQTHKETAFQSIRKRIAQVGRNQSHKTGRTKIIYLATTLAASLLLFVVVKLTLPTNQLQFKNTNEKIATIMLPDSSRILLSQNSEIQFAESHFSRKIALKGEAYFEITRGKKLTVETQYGQITVLGTRFQVSTKKESMQTICFEGLVKVKPIREKPELLHSGMSLLVNQSEKTTPIKILDQYPEVAFFNANYENETQQVVIADIEDFYGVQIDFQVQNQQHFSGSFHTPLVNDALDILCLTMGYNWNFKPNSKLKIIIHT